MWKHYKNIVRWQLFYKSKVTHFIIKLHALLTLSLNTNQNIDVIIYFRVFTFCSYHNKHCGSNKQGIRHTELLVFRDGSIPVIIHRPNTVIFFPLDDLSSLATPYQLIRLYSVVQNRHVSLGSVTDYISTHTTIFCLIKIFGLLAKEGSKALYNLYSGTTLFVGGTKVNSSSIMEIKK